MKGWNTVKLGVFISAAVLVFILGIYFIGQKRRLFSKVITVSCTFNDVGGLRIGNNVRLSGINVGTVSDIRLATDSSVVVEMNIDDDAKKFIKKDAKAVISSEGLMGNKSISIIPGDGKKAFIANNDRIGSVQPITFDDILVRLDETTGNASEITYNLNEIIQSIRMGHGTIGKLFMDTVFAKDVSQTMVNLKKGTKGFDENMKAAKKSIFLRGGFKDKKKKGEEKKEGKDQR